MIKIPPSMLTDQRIGPSAFKIYCAIYYLNDQGIDASYQNIQDYAGMSHRTVVINTKCLLSADLIERSTIEFAKTKRYVFTIKS